MPTWLIHVFELDPQKNIEHPKMWGAFARLSCIFVANKIRVGESAPYALCSRELLDIEKAGLAGS